MEDSSGKEREKDTLRVLSSKRSKTTKTNCWVDKDLTKSHKKKGFEENGAVQNAVKNRTNKIWVEVELSKLPMKNIEIKKKKILKDSQNVRSLQSRSVFLTLNHRGPLPLRELHSTDETLVWRDPGGSCACLRPVYHYG